MAEKGQLVSERTKRHTRKVNIKSRQCQFDAKAAAPELRTAGLAAQER